MIFQGGAGSGPPCFPPLDLHMLFMKLTSVFNKSLFKRKKNFGNIYLPILLFNSLYAG